MKLSHITLLSILCIGTINLGMADKISRIPRNVYRGATSVYGGAKAVISYPLYHPPFQVLFTIQKTSATDFILTIRPVGANVGFEAKTFNNTVFSLSGQLVQNSTQDFIYNSTTIYQAHSPALNDANNNFKELINEKYLQSLFASTAEDGINKIQIFIGNNDPMSRLYTNLYNDIADFAQQVGVAFPRIESSIHSFLFNNKTKALALTLLAAGVGYAAYKYSDQIPTMQQIGDTTLRDLGSGTKSFGSSALSNIGSTLKSGGSSTASSLGSAIKGGFSSGWSSLNRAVYGTSNTPSTSTQQKPSMDNTPTNNVLFSPELSEKVNSTKQTPSTPLPSDNTQQD